MIDKSSVKKRLSDLADEVSTCDENAASRLRELARVVDNPSQDRHPWETADLYHLINPDGIVESYRHSHKSSRWITWLEIGRNTLIFAPITLTWIAIWQATTHYNNMIVPLVNAHSDQANLPFLYLWQEGFNSTLPGWLTLGSVAMVDFIFLSIILFCTFFAHLLTNQRERAAHYLYTELAHVIGETSFYLSTQRLTDADNLEKVANRIDAMAKDAVKSIAEQVQKVTDKSSDMAADLSTRLSETSTKTTETLQVMSRDLTKSFQEVSQKATTLLDNIDQSAKTRQTSGDAYIDQLGQLAKGATQLQQDLQKAASDLQTSGEKLGTYVTQLVNSTDKLAAQQKDQYDAIAAASKNLSSASGTLVDLSQKQEVWLTGLQGTISRLQTAVEQMDVYAKSEAEREKHLAAFLTQLTREQEAQNKQTEQVIKATSTLKNTLETMREGTTEVRHIAISMNDIIRLQAKVPQTLASDLTSVVQGHTKAAQAIESSAGTLNASVQTINQVLPNLEQLVRIQPLYEELSRTIVELRDTVTQFSSKAATMGTASEPVGPAPVIVKRKTAPLNDLEPTPQSVLIELPPVQEVPGAMPVQPQVAESLPQSEETPSESGVVQGPPMSTPDAQAIASTRATPTLVRQQRNTRNTQKTSKTTKPLLDRDDPEDFS